MYVAVFYSPSSDIPCKRSELQPLPDFIRRVRTEELHYLPLEEAFMINDGHWVDIPDAFLSTEILDLCFNSLYDPPKDIMKQISLLVWIPPHEVEEYKKKLDEQLHNQVKVELEKIRWKEVPSYNIREHVSPSWYSSYTSYI